MSRGLLIGLLVGLSATASRADVHQSVFGFQIDLPSNWGALSLVQGKEKPDVVEAALAVAQKDTSLTSMPKYVLSKVKEMLMAGVVEYYSSRQPGFYVSVYRGAGHVPEHGYELKERCQAFPAELSKRSEKRVAVHECTMKKVADRNALYLVADEYADDYPQREKYVQYEISKGPNELLIFTLTGGPEVLESVKRDFDEMMRTVEFKRSSKSGE